MRKLYIIFLFLLFGCSSEEPNKSSFFETVTSKIFNVSDSNEKLRTELLPGDYIGWVENEENGLRVSKQMQEYNFTLQYKPLDYVVLLDLKKGDFSKEEFKEKKETFEGVQYFTLRIESSQNNNLLKAGITRQEQEYERMQYFSFLMQEDLQLADGKDTLKCVLYHYERTYNITPYSDFIIGFEIPKRQDKSKVKYNKDKVLIFNDQVLGIGTVKLKIKKEDLNNIPTLTTTNNESNS